MKKFFSTLFILVLFLSASAFAQYKVGKNTAGILGGFGGGGLSGTGSIPISLEYNFLNFEEKIHGGIFASYSSSSEEYNFGFWNGEWTYTYIIVAAQANYHFSPGESFDPFVGVALGYNIGSASWEWKSNGTGASPAAATAGGFFYSGQAGFNYWFSEGLAVQVRAGYYPYIAAGLTFGL